MIKIKRIIFVSYDDTCLGPLAESIFNRISVGYGVEAISRGVVVLFPEPLNTKMLQIMEQRGLVPAHSVSCQLTASDITEDSLVLAMTDADVEMVKEISPNVRIRKLREFAGQRGDIETPHGKGIEDYEQCYEHIDLLTKMAAQVILKEDMK